MAPKRAPKKAAPPPPPPPEESSGDETRSGSRSRSDESEDEDAIAESPVPAATPALKNAPAPAKKGDESESSGEEEEDDDEEEEEEEKRAEPARAAPKKQPPPPQEKEDSEASGDEEDDEEEEEEEEPTRAAPPSAAKKQPPQPAKKDDSDSSGDEEEEEAPPAKPAPKKDAAALKPPALALPAAADEAKKPGGFQRIWSTDDEVRILEALAAHQKQHGTFPHPDALVDVLAGKLDNHAFGNKELWSKVRSLKQRYTTLSKRGEAPSKEHDRRVLDLSKIVWDGDKTVVSSGDQKGFEEMCELYPYLAEEVKELEAARPGMCKREFGKMDDDKARAMDEKIKKQRVVQIRVEMRRGDLVKEVTKALMDVVDG